jgi:hypothetical protein
MTEENNPVSEGEAQDVQGENAEVQTEEQAQPEEKQERQVPLAALEAERRKRQEAEAEKRVYEQHLAQISQPQQQQEEDGDDWVTKKEYRQTMDQEMAKRDQKIIEEAFVQAKPEAYKEVNDYLPELIKQKPWVKDVVENAPNRWQRAHELVSDLYHKPEPQKKSQDAQRIVENAQKPGSPTNVGKSATMSKVDYMRSIRGTADWDQYRAKVRRGEA